METNYLKHSNLNEIRDILRNYESEESAKKVSIEEYRRHIQEIATAYQRSYNRVGLINELQAVFCVRVKNSMGEYKYLKPQQVVNSAEMYGATDSDLRQYFNLLQIPSVFIMDIDPAQILNWRSSSWWGFASHLNLGISDSYQKLLSYEEQCGFNAHLLHYIRKINDLNSSLVLWRIVTRLWVLNEGHNRSQINSLPKKFRIKPNAKKPVRFVEDLQRYDWMFSKDKKKIQPRLTRISELHPQYDVKHIHETDWIYYDTEKIESIQDLDIERLLRFEKEPVYSPDDAEKLRLIGELGLSKDDLLDALHHLHALKDLLCHDLTEE